MSRPRRGAAAADLLRPNRGARRAAARSPLSPRRQDPGRPWARRWYLAIAALALGGAALFASSSALATSPPSPAAPQYLFSIPSASGSLRGPNDQHLTLRLIGARRYLTRFTDRPLRKAFVVANVDFARRFKSYFASSAPNAVLTYTPPGARIPVSIVLTIRQPRWNAKHRTWTFRATRIRKQPDNLPGTTVHIKPPFLPTPRSFKHATLLIDDAANNGYCTVGDINYFPASRPLQGYVRARGQVLPIDQWSALYYVIGGKFGGNEDYFLLPNLPDLQANVAPYICVSGAFPTPESGVQAPCMAGNVQLTGETDYVRNGWLPADGRLHQIAAYPTLYSQIGTAFGGDGVQSFAMPKLDAPSGLQNIICANGSGWDPSVYSPYQCTVSEVDLFATTSQPGAELLADGRLLPINASVALFSLLGTTFGGDGSHTFGLPNPPVPLNGTSWAICGQGAYPQFY